MTDDHTELGHSIRFRRRDAGMSQQRLADAVGVSQPYISMWERGQQLPSPAHQKALNDVLGVPESDESALDSVVSEFGVWLAEERSKRRWSVPQLAKITGLSSVALYMIESGRTANPRAETRQRISIALGAAVPAEVVELTEEQTEIPGLGSLVDFDPHDDSDRPTESGVYVFYDVSDHPLYVGRSDNIRRRVREHQDKFWFKAPIVQSASYVRVDDDQLRTQVEQVLIRFLKSNAVLNKQHVDR